MGVMYKKLLKIRAIKGKTNSEVIIKSAIRGYNLEHC